MEFFGNLSRDHPFVYLINLWIYQKIQHEILNKNHEKNFRCFGHLKFQKLQFFCHLTIFSFSQHKWHLELKGYPLYQYLCLDKFHPNPGWWPIATSSSASAATCSIFHKKSLKNDFSALIFEVKLVRTNLLYQFETVTSLGAFWTVLGFFSLQWVIILNFRGIEEWLGLDFRSIDFEELF